MATRVSIKYGGTGANTVEGIRQALNVLSTSGGTFTGNVNVNGTLNVNSNVLFTGVTSNVTGILNVTSNTILTGTLNVASNVIVEGTINSNSNVLFAGATTNVTGNLIVTGTTNVASNVIVQGTISSNSNVLFAGATTNVTGNLIVTGTTNVASNVIVDGAMNVASILTANTRGIFGTAFNAHAADKNINLDHIVIGGIKNVNGPTEVLVVNKSNGSVAYSEFIALNDRANQQQGWISVGVNSSNYNDPEFTLTGPDDGYLLFEAPQGTTANGDLIIGTGSYGDENRIVLAAGGFEPTDAQLIIAPANLKSALITQSSLNANIAILTTSTTHNFIANDVVIISSVGAPYDGTRTIIDVTSNTFNVSITSANVVLANVAGEAEQFLPFNKGTVELTAQLFVGEDSRSTIEAADITLIQGHAIPLGIVVDNDGPGQTVMFNKSNGALSYSEFIAHNDVGNVEHGWISVGINSSGYDDPEFPITKADDGYLLYEPPEGTTGDGDLIIGTGTFGQKNRLIFAAEGFDEANAQMIITPNESVRISIDTDASSSNTGALQVVGGVGVQGSMYVQGNQTIQGDLIVNGSQIIQSIENLAAAGPISLVSDGNVANTWDQGIVGTYAVATSSVAHDVEFKEIANNTGIISTSNNHSFIVEDIVTLAGVDATFNGTHRITAVTANTLSFYLLAGNASKTSGSGTATVDKTTKYTGLVKKASDGTWRLFSNLGSRPAFNTDLSAANLAYDSIIAGSADFRGTLKLGSPNTATISYTDNNARTLTIPALSGDRTFAFIDQAQTFTAAQGFNSTVTATKFIPTAGDATGNGLYLPSANRVSISADGVERVAISATETVINDGSADYDFRVESDGVAHMLFVDGGTNTVGIGTNAPAANLHVVGSGYFSENVGIGTSSPANKLHVYTGASGRASFDARYKSIIEHNGEAYLALAVPDTSFTGIRFLNATGTSSGVGRLEYDMLANALDLWSAGITRFYNNSAERMRITSGGNVGIGTTSPDNLLHVESTFAGTIAKIKNNRGNASTDAGLEVETSTTAAKTLLIKNSGTDRFWVQGDGTSYFNGNVGIGTTSPGTKLHILDSTGPVIRLVRTSNRFDVEADNNAMSLVSRDSATANLIISGFNGVGIGTTNPNTGRLDIRGGDFSLESGYKLIVNTTAGGNNYLLCPATANPRLGIFTAGSERISVSYSDGLVGIGTTNPGAKLQVVGDFRFGTNSTYTDLRFFTDTPVGSYNQTNTITPITTPGSGTATTALYLKSAVSGPGTNRIDLLVDGNVGIGTTSPGVKFAVRGSTDLGDSHASSLSATHTTRISGYALRYDESNRYGNYGLLIFNADTGWTSGARRYMITNGLGANKFAIIRSDGGTVDPTLADAGAISSGTADFVIDNSGNVGIGTTNPGYPLHVNGTSYFNGNVQGSAFHAGGRDAPYTSISETSSDAMSIFGHNARANSSFANRVSAQNTGYHGHFIRMYYSDGITFTTSTGTKTVGDVLYDANSALIVSGTAERMRIDTGGNVGIGTTTTSRRFQVSFSSGTVYNSSSMETTSLLTRFVNPDTTTGSYSGIHLAAGNNSDAAIAGVRTADAEIALTFGTRGTGSGNIIERMRITSLGALLIGRTGIYGDSNDRFVVDGGLAAFTRASNYPMYVNRDTSTGTLIEFSYNGSGGKGNISTDGTNVAYNTSSDRRLKSNILPADSAGSVIDNIQIVKHDWNTGKHTRYGIIAQDLYRVAPEAVSVGDSEDVETLKNPWGVDYSKLVPMLIKEIQELRARVAELENK